MDRQEFCRQLRMRRCRALCNPFPSLLLLSADQATAHLPSLHLALEGRAALVRGDVVHKRLHVRDGADRQQVHAEDDAPARHVLGGHLAPPAGGSAQVDANLGRTEEVIFLVDLRAAAASAREREGSGTR